MPRTLKKRPNPREDPKGKSERDTVDRNAGLACGGGSL
jgi:hypothetical protein